MSLKSRSKNRRIKKQKYSNSEIKKLFLSSRIIIFSVIFVIFSLPTTTVRHSAFQQSLPIPISEILQAQIDAGQSLLDFQEQAISYLETPVPEMIKTKLKPVLHKLSSFRTQIQQYEKMEQIPGGPVHFIATVGKALDLLEEQDLPQIKIEGVELIDKLMNNGVAEASERVIEAEQLALEVLDLPALNDEGIEIRPLDEDGLNFVDTVGKDVDLKDVLNIYRDLARMYRLLELASTSKKMGCFPLERGILAFENCVKKRNESIEFASASSTTQSMMVFLNATQSELLKNKEKYKLLFPLKMRFTETLVHIRKRIENFNQELNGQSLDLMSMTLDEIKTLRTRLENLKHKYIKKPRVQNIPMFTRV